MSRSGHTTGSRSGSGTSSVFAAVARSACSSTLALVTAGLALWQNSLALLLVHLFVDSLIALYVAALAQMKQQRQWRLKVTHVSERPTEWDEPQIKVIAQ